MGIEEIIRKLYDEGRIVFEPVGEDIQVETDIFTEERVSINITHAEWKNEGDEGALRKLIQCVEDGELTLRGGI